MRRRRLDEMARLLEESRKNEALLRQHVGWLTQSVNRLENERALLLQKLTGLAVPVPQVEFVPPTAAPRAPAERPPTVGIGAPLRENTARDPVQGIDFGAITLGAAQFDDMGDEEAARQHIGEAEVIVAVGR